MHMKNKQPAHPGEILLRDFIRPRELSQAAVAQALRIPIQRVNTIIRGKRGISAETAILLAGYFKNRPEYWMRLQVAYDLHQARKELAAA